MKSGDVMRARTEYDAAVKRDPKAAVRNVVSPLFGGK